MHTTNAALKMENILSHTSGDPIQAVFPRGAEEEVLFEYCRPVHPATKLIDFCCATYRHEDHPKKIHTRKYRAPQVILESGWSKSSDMWSLGCIAMEMDTGRYLYQSSNRVGHLVLIEKVLGRSVRPDLSREQIGLEEATSISQIPSLAEHVLRQHTILTDVAALMMRPDPAQRPVVSELLRHQFFSEVLPDSD
jgi:dual-specificity kinase